MGKEVLARRAGINEAVVAQQDVNRHEDLPDQATL